MTTYVDLGWRKQRGYSLMVKLQTHNLQILGSNPSSRITPRRGKFPRVAYNDQSSQIRNRTESITLGVDLN